MKRFIISLLAVVLANAIFLSATAPVISPDGTCRSVRLCGRVRIVADDHADFRVRIVNDAHADLRVRWTDAPRRVGEWRKVESHPDFTVRLVESHPDFTIRVVDDHPGLP